MWMVEGVEHVREGLMSWEVAGTDAFASNVQCVLKSKMEMQSPELRKNERRV